MDTLLLIVVTFAGYILAYYTYGRFLARKIFNLRPDAVVPSRELEDGKDYVPTKRGIIFGHHFTSIAGTGPIVGPAIGIIWGWVPALIWVFVGSIVMGAVHDFGSLVMSLRHQGRSIADITSEYINPRVRLICFLVVFLELWIVIAIFGLVIAVLFKLYPQSVFPIWMEIPIAVWLGYFVYKRKGNVVLGTVVAVAAMYATVYLGHYLRIEMPKDVMGIPHTGVWTIILLVYAYIASTLRVTTLLQPRDYINAWQLFVMMLLLTGGAVASSLWGGLHIVAPPFNVAQGNAVFMPMVPFIFVTIACGAISGFHSLVSSGTSSKQLSNERDAQLVGYGSMLMEGALATLVIVAVAAGIGMGYDGPGGVQVKGLAAWNAHYGNFAAANQLGGKVTAVVEGSANMMKTLGVPRFLGLVIMGVFIASFAGTTLDTATRIQRYVICELSARIHLPALGNKWIATGVAVVTAGLLAFSTGAGGAGAMTLWPMFGAVNQLLAALALLLLTLYLRRRGGVKYLVALIPCLFMLVITVWAMYVNERGFIKDVNAGLDTMAKTGLPLGKALLAFINGAALLLALWMATEGFVALFKQEEKIVAAEEESHRV